MASLTTLAPVLAAGGITDINPGLTLWTGITFLVLLVVLAKFAWGPIVKMLAERERTIRDAIESAKRERAEAERLLAEQKHALAQAQREAAELAKRNQQEVEKLRQELTERAR
jgi:F-type H+-transporting ATPase subunit b